MESEAELPRWQKIKERLPEWYSLSVLKIVINGIQRDCLYPCTRTNERLCSPTKTHAFTLRTVN